MNSSLLRRISKNRILAIVPPDGVGAVLQEHARRADAALLGCNHSYDVPKLRPTVEALLDAGCEYFVCFGAAAEALHDDIDECLVDRGLPQDRTVMTTWHSDEPALDIVEFFVNVAGAREGSFMVAALGPNDHALEQLLLEQASGQGR